MDYIEDELKSEFVFVNPNSKGSCGCGEMVDTMQHITSSAVPVRQIIQLIVASHHCGASTLNCI